MAEPLYLCAYRKGSSDDAGRREAPTACINGRSDPAAKFNGVAGNCNGVFSGWPACRGFLPSLETRTGREYWAMQEPVLEKPFALKSRIPTLAEVLQSNVRIPDSAADSVLKSIRADRERLLAILR